MKVRMAVARCCCPRPGIEPPTPGPPSDTTQVFYGWWQNGGTFIENQPLVNPLFIGNSFGGAAEPFTPTPFSAYWGYTVNLAQGTQLFDARLVIRTVSASGIQCTQPGSWPRSQDNFGVVCVFSTQARCTAYGEDIDNAVEYTTAPGIDAATRTPGTNETYDVASGATSGDAFMYDGDTDVVLADVTAQAQAILNRPGWVANNTMQFFLEENGSDFSGTSTPQIFRTWMEVPTNEGLTPSVVLRIRLPL